MDNGKLLNLLINVTLRIFSSFELLCSPPAMAVNKIYLVKSS